MQKEFFGKNSIYQLDYILKKHKPKKIFLVTGKSSYEKSGAKAKLDKILIGYKVIHFDDFSINPKIEEIEKGLKIFKNNKCDFIIAIGGGSAIDIAKAINILSNNPGNLDDYIKKKRQIRNKGKVMVAIPTTAGSGSEATQFIVFYAGKTKCSLVHKEYTLPDYAIIDPVLTESLPAYITACTGMDALSQAIESYWCIDSTEKSKKYARQAIKIIIKNLKNAVNRPSYKNREEMAKAANLAGKAIHITRTTACHAISYPFTSYFNIPHGHAVALTIPSMLVYNFNVTERDVLDKRGVKYVKKTIIELSKLLWGKAPEEAASNITKLMRDVGLKTKLSELGIKTESDIETIIRNGFNPDRVSNNPRLLTEEALRKMLHDIA